MAKFSFEDMDNYGGMGANKYFNLKNDKDVATIRFLYNNINDIQGTAVHEIEVNGKKMDVECIREYNEPIEKCPLCANGYNQQAKLYLPVYDEDTQESKIWTRGKSFFTKLSSLCARYNPLVSMPIEVERNGKPGDKKTEYALYPLTGDNKQISDFPTIDAEGIAYQAKTYEELLEFIKTGNFPQLAEKVATTRQNARMHQNTTEMPIRRRPKYNDEESF